MLTIGEAIEKIKFFHGEVFISEVSKFMLTEFDEQLMYYHVRSTEGEGWIINSETGKVFTAKAFWRRRRNYDKHAL